MIFVLTYNVTGTSDERWITANTVSDKDKFGWMTSTALEENNVSVNVHMLIGELTIVNMMKMLLSPVRTAQQVTTEPR